MASINLQKTTVSLNNPSNISYYPILADKAHMSDKEDPKKVEAQANKINSIIQNSFDDFTVKTVQGQKTSNYTYRASSYRSAIVDNVKDCCYNEYGNISFDFYAINIKKGSLTPVLRLNIKSIVGNITFVGLDDLNKPQTSLSTYGYFILTKNNIAGENQLSFFATSNVPEKIFHTSCSFIIGEVNQDVAVLGEEKSEE